MFWAAVPIGGGCGPIGCMGVIGGLVAAGGPDCGLVGADMPAVAPGMLAVPGAIEGGPPAARIGADGVGSKAMFAACVAVCVAMALVNVEIMGCSALVCLLTDLVSTVLSFF